MTPTTLAADAAQALQGVTDGPWIANGAAVNTKPDGDAQSA
jgi:hypothetical protein